MTHRHLSTLPTPQEAAALEGALGPMFAETAAVPNEEVLARLIDHATELGNQEAPTLTLWHGFALAAVALFALFVGQWTVVIDHPLADDFDDVAWLDDGLDDGFDLLVLPSESHDPARALEVVDALIAELEDA